MISLLPTAAQAISATPRYRAMWNFRQRPTRQVPLRKRVAASARPRNNATAPRGVAKRAWFKNGDRHFAEPCFFTGRSYLARSQSPFLNHAQKSDTAPRRSSSASFASLRCSLPPTAQPGFTHLTQRARRLSSPIAQSAETNPLPVFDDRKSRNHRRPP